MITWVVPGTKGVIACKLVTGSAAWVVVVAVETDVEGLDAAEDATREPEGVTLDEVNPQPTAATATAKSSRAAARRRRTSARFEGPEGWDIKVDLRRTGWQSCRDPHPENRKAALTLRSKAAPHGV